MGHSISLCFPIKVGAIDPVGITKASASNVRNRNANTKAMITDSIVSRTAEGENQADSGGALAASLRTGCELLRRIFASTGLRFTMRKVHSGEQRGFNE